MAFVERKASSSKQGQKQKHRPQVKVKSNQARRDKHDNEISKLEQRIANYEAPSEVTSFDQLPLSSQTLKGLKSSHFTAPTPIQILSIPPALAARDVLGSARTGSGKTLAFLIPMLERLLLLKWGPMDGLGAVVISPTRELAVQTFTALRDIGKYHNFSAGLVIGGKPLKEEQDRLGRMNILIATPGRLLQHLDSTVGFESSAVKVLVLDEADRLLDLGFLPALRAIVGHFTQMSADGRPDRQTLLFSATQSKDLAALAKLSLHDPLYINCNKAGEEGVMPSTLEQFSAVVPLPRKMDALWGFIKSHLKMKGVVFVSSGKQVRFIYETFRRLHPGLPLLHLHGKQKQTARLGIFQRFSTMPSALLVTTDVSARGLDFPSVDWVVQLDCPEDVDTYIHRVGRTARYKAEGKGLIFLTPSEADGMDARWKDKGIEVKRIKIKESKMGNLRQQMQNFAFREPEIKYLGQRAFISYMRSIHIQKDKTVFDFAAYPAEEYAASLGLPGAPQIRLTEGKGGRKRGAGKEEKVEVAQVDIGVESESEDEDQGGASGGDEEDEHDEESEEESEQESAPVPAKNTVRTKYDRMFERKNQSILTPHYTALVSHGDDASGAGAEDEDDDDLFTLARPNHDLDGAVSGSTGGAVPTSDDLSKRKLKLASSKKGQVRLRQGGDKVVFDEEGEATDFYKSGRDAEVAAAAERGEFVGGEKERMRAADVLDREVAREKKREKKRKRKEREREMREGGAGGDGSDDDGDGDGDGVVAYLGGGSGDEDEYGNGYGASDGDEEERPRDRERASNKRSRKDEGVEVAAGGVEDDEALALRLLRGE